METTAKTKKTPVSQNTQTFAETKAPALMNFKIKKSEDYSDAEILVYNSMINAARIIAENS
jgi:hypothetical protein